MNDARNGSGTTRNCLHTESIETTNYGLKRRACLECGIVIVIYAEPVQSEILFQIPALGER